MTEKEVIEKFGQPGDVRNFVTIEVPYPMRIAWDLSKTVTHMQVHKDAATSLLEIFKELLSTYGLTRLKELEIDIFGGCYNLRQMRGGSDMSVHSWALAIDLNPTKNTLQMNANTAQFAKPEYKLMMDIFYKHGWFSLGKEKNYDFMHFQFFKP